jgi:hypothetical protein
VSKVKKPSHLEVIIQVMVELVVILEISHVLILRVGPAKYQNGQVHHVAKAVVEVELIAGHVL